MKKIILLFMIFSLFTMYGCSKNKQNDVVQVNNTEEGTGKVLQGGEVKSSTIQENKVNRPGGNGGF